MHFYSQAPSREIATWIERLWSLEVSADELESAERCAPDGAVEILVHLGSPLVEARAGKSALEQPRCAVVGHVVNPVLLEARGAVRVVAARLRPAAVGPFFRVPACELVGKTIAAEALLGLPGRALLERVASAEDPLGELAAAISDLAPGSSRDGLTHRAAHEIDAARGRIKLEALARALGATGRSLQRHFRDELGISPKRFAILRRFERTCTEMRCSPQAPLVEIALAGGYADQPHFTREFRTLIGVPPRRWLAKERRLHHLLNQDRV